MMTLVLAASAMFSFGEIKVECENTCGWKIDLSREVASDGAEVAKVSLENEKPEVPPKFALSFTMPQNGHRYRWTSNRNDCYLPPEWWSNEDSAFSRGVPVYAFFDGNETTHLSVAISEGDRLVKFKGGIREEGCLIACRLSYFEEAEAPIKKYETYVRLDTRPTPFAKSIRDASAWVEKQGGYPTCTPPKAAFDPLYSSWYNFHQNVFDKDIEAECEIASKMGMKTIIIDDGWQTDDTNRGYAFCGDWEVSPRRFPDMRAHVKRVQDMGMKYMVWYSVPFIGKNSKNYEKFKGKFVSVIEGLGAGVLDPRFPEVREFLVSTYVKAMKEWGIDGFKLDFIDSICWNGEDPAIAENYAGRDIKNLPLAVSRLFHEIREALVAINPDVLIEFRQSYVGPAIRQYGNMLRVGDCPGSIDRNRIAIANLRLASGKSAVHSDMLEWNDAMKPEDAALFIINSIFGVVQYSAMLRETTPTHREMIAKWIKFSQDHRETLLHGVFTPHHAELQYPIIESESANERIIAIYADCVIADVKGNKKTILLNATGKNVLTIRRDGKIVEVPCASGSWCEIK